MTPIPAINFATVSNLQLLPEFVSLRRSDEPLRYGQVTERA
jgi:hypothetical protein